MNDLKKNAPLILLMIAFCFQYAIFIRPEQLRASELETRSYMQSNYVTKETFEATVAEMASDIRAIKIYLINKGR